MDDSTRSEAEWDAEIEADFQRAVANTRVGGRRKRGSRLIGAPLAFLSDVRRSTEGCAPVIVAMLIYRRTCVCHSQTVKLPGGELAELGVNRQLKWQALHSLEASGLIRIERAGRGRAATVTLLWRMA